MPLPTVVIIGRPNVGKSSLLNRLARKRISIVDPTAGVTRDRIDTVIELPNPDDMAQPFHIRLVDTGGYGIIDSQNLTVEVERQIALGIAEADLVLFLVDAQQGILALDQTVAELLRTSMGQKPVLLVCNKVDDQSFEAQAYETMRLGFSDPVMISATNGYHISKLHDAIRRNINFTKFDEEDALDEGIKIAVVGKRNAGKSTMINALVGEERVIVSEQEGTTRDSVDVRVEIGDKIFTMIDTAGLRKRKSVKQDIEYYSMHRALRSVRRADVCLLMIDSTVPISQVDRQLANEILAHHRPTVIVVNKWDLAQHNVKVSAKNEDDTEQTVYTQYMDKELKGLDFAPIAFTSAIDGKGLRELLGLALSLYEQTRHRVGTGELNRIMEKITRDRQPPAKRGKYAKLYYTTQIGEDPPTLAMFVNIPDLFDGTYQRYLLNRMRDELAFSEVPIKLLIRGKTKMTAAERLASDAKNAG